MAFFIIFGLAVTAFGIFMCRSRAAEIRSAETYVGEITGMYEKAETRSITGAGAVIVKKVYCPVVRYEKNGSLKTAEHQRYTDRMLIPYSVGDKVMICISPASPKKFWFANEETHIDYAGLAVIIAGSAWTLIGLIFIL